MKKQINTLCVHPVEDEERTSAVTSAIYPSTSYSHIDEDERIYPGFFSTYNQKRLGRIMAQHEGGDLGIIFNSGMAAITASMLAFLKSGDHVIFSSPLYGGTMKFATEELPKLGVTYSFAGPSVESFRALVMENTKIIFLETPSNPLLSIFSIAEIAALAKLHNIITIADNTLASSVNQRPIERGFDISIQSGTKYLGGHNDLQFGSLVVKDKSLGDEILRVGKLYGGSLSPELCYQAERSIKTLALRVARQNENALAVATFLSTQHLVTKVYYPGLKDHPDFETASQQMDGFSGVFSFELATGNKGVKLFLKSLSLITPALSFGGVESVICIPAKTSHSAVTSEVRKKLGISDGLLRMSVGIEAVTDIISDLRNALDKLSVHEEKTKGLLADENRVKNF